MPRALQLQTRRHARLHGRQESQRGARPAARSAVEPQSKPSPSLPCSHAHERISLCQARSGTKGDYVERNEFRLLLSYLRSYLELYAAFNRVDTSDDRRVDLGEWREGVSLLAKWGINLSPEEVDDEFARVDKNGGGVILFDEFCEWAIAHKLDIEDDDEESGNLLDDLPPPPEKPQAPAYPGQRPAGYIGVARPVVAAATTEYKPKAYARDPTAFGGGFSKAPRPTSARADVGSIGWRGGGTSDRGKSSATDAAEVERRQQALQMVAANAASGFARANAQAPPRSDDTAKAATAAEQLRIQQALKAVGRAAKAGVTNALSLDERENRVWSAQQRKSKPNMKMITQPPALHVPATHDKAMGKASDPYLLRLEKGEIDISDVPEAGASQGKIPPMPMHKVREKDQRMWRCQRCHTMQRPSSLSCVACSQARSAHVKVHVKPAKWTKVK